MARAVRSPMPYQREPDGQVIELAQRGDKAAWSGLEARPQPGHCDVFKAGLEAGEILIDPLDECSVPLGPDGAAGLD